MASVRPAVLADAPKVARIGVRAWQAAYQGLMPDGYLDQLSVEQRTASWERGLARPVEPGHARLVVEDDDGEVAGFVVTGPTRSGEGTGEGRLHIEHTHGAGPSLAPSGSLRRDPLNDPQVLRPRRLVSRRGEDGRRSLRHGCRGNALPT